MSTATTSTPALDVTVKDLPAQDYLGVAFTAAVGSVGREVQGAFGRLYARIGEARSRPTGPPFLIAARPKDGVMQIEVGAPCAPVPAPTEGLLAGRLQATRAAVLLHRGPYDQIGPTYEKVLAWIGQHGLRQSGAPREVYLNGPDQATSPADYLTELVVPIA